MPVTLLLAGLRMPADVAAAVAPALQAPALRLAFGRATRGALARYPDAAHRHWLGGRLFKSGDGSAPYAYAVLAGHQPGDDAIWCADPIHLELARDHLTAMPLAAPPRDNEADGLLAVANRIADGSGLRFERVGSRWFAHAPRTWQLDAAPLDTVWGRSLHGLLPEGRDAAHWNRLLNEIQMAWHAHPVNDEREARGEQTVNSMWLHDGGVWTALPTGLHTAVASDAAELAGAAQAAGMQSIATNAPWPDGALAVWNDALQPRLLHDWPAWQGAFEAIDKRLAGRLESTSIDFVVAGRHTTLALHWRPTDRLKFWRRRPLEEVLSE